MSVAPLCSAPAKKGWGAGAPPGASPPPPLRGSRPPLPRRSAAPRSLWSLRPGARPPNRSLRGFCGGSCRPHPPLLRGWAGARRTAPAGRRPSDTRPAAPLLRSQAGARRTAPAGRRPSDTCLAAPFAPCVGHPNAPVGRDRVLDTRSFVVAPRVFCRLPPELAATATHHHRRGVTVPATVC